MSSLPMVRSREDASPSEKSIERACVAQSPLENLRNLLPSFNFSSSSSSGSSSAGSSSSSLNSIISSVTSNLPFPVDDTIAVGALSALAGIGLAMGGTIGYRRYWRRIKNSNDITGKMLGGKKWVKGVVTSVGDGDNFRLFHTPGPFWRYPLKLRRIPETSKELRDQTLHIRITGVDAPEMAHFGNPAQPHGKESLDWLRGFITGKRMKVQILRRDQYNRIVGVPYILRTFLPKKALPPIMLKEGMAVVYEAGGAEYGPWGLDGLKKFEAQAKKARKGLWGLKKFEHPGDYKKRMKLAEEGRVGEGGTVLSKKSTGLWGLVKRLFGR